MSMSIRSNISSLDAQRNLSSTQMQLDQSLARLSSGYRISTAADDAAGLAISEKLRSQIRGLNQAARNAQDGISMIQTGEGAMGEVHSMLQRMRELAVQSSNDTLTQSDRGAVNTELTQLSAEINGISSRTTFNGKQLLTGSLVTAQSGGTAQAGNQFNGAGGNSSIGPVDVSNAKAGETYTFSAGPTATSLTLTRGSDSVAQTIDISAGFAAGAAGSLNFSQLGVKVGVTTDSGGKTGAGLVTDLTAATITTAAANGSANLQVGANASDSISVAFAKVDTSASSLNLDALLTAFSAAVSGGTNSAQVTASQNLLTGVDSAINTVSSLRSNLGAYQNRLDHTIKNVNTTSENLSASESRIRDVNVAEESANMTRSNVLMQAGVSVLAQANQLPQLALKLLG